MKKVIFILIIIGIFSLWYMKTPIISLYLSKKLNLPISIQNISFSKSHIKIENFRIRNPKGHNQKVAFSSKKIEVFYGWDKLKKTPAIIDRIEMLDNFLNIECKNPLCSSNNWTEIMKDSRKKEKKEKKEVLVKLIRMNNLFVDIQKMGVVGGEKKITLENIEFKDVSSKEGFPIKELIAIIFKKAKVFDFIKSIYKGQFLDIFKIFGEEESSPPPKL
ncbi:MAG: hypothetical protein AMS24_03975 [Chlamydiae bacterium SM23_39]|nr:MAG: hypothetical protein AMS24_03975 [Chlamydiae bacterium SM23_39]